MDTTAGPMELSVRDALTARPAAERDPRDTATAQLALTYAQAIDTGADLAKVGPPLLAALEALRLSPRARAGGKGVTGDTPAAGQLDELRSRRARKSRTSTVDTATS
ncbi:hypothetical protein HCB17_10730 [Salinispora arenicola]|uniref:hypothetical protein n=1 Tax=Salinispora arenicola TaxID=168697 RepID=UPI00142FBBF6|nr:hypothetical protein [Salinispora arenicola]NIL41596.1 hypothetical protein [Salinispora arenicola]